MCINKTVYEREYLANKTVVLIVKSQSDDLSLEKTPGETFPLRVKCGKVNHVFISQAHSWHNPSQFEESAAYTIAADTMKTILGELRDHEGTLTIGKFNCNFSDELVCGIKKLMKP